MYKYSYLRLSDPATIITWSVSPITHSSASETSLGAVPRLRWQDLHWPQWLHTSAAPTRPSSEGDPSVRHIQTPALNIAPFSLAQLWVAVLTEALTSMTVPTTDSSPRAGQFIPSVVRLCWCFDLTAMYINAPEEGFWCSTFYLLLHVFLSLAVNRCCLEARITCAVVSPASVISASDGVVGHAPRMDLPCWTRSGWRSSRLSTCVGSHHGLYPFSTNAWTQAIKMAHRSSRTTPDVFLLVPSPTLATLAVFMHWLWCSLNIRCPSIQKPNQSVPLLWNCTTPFPTLMLAVVTGLLKPNNQFNIYWIKYSHLN